MNQEQAIQILKAAIDMAIQKGAYPNLETISQIGQALSLLINEKK